MSIKSISQHIKILSKDLVGLLYPQKCVGCDSDPAIDNDIFCVKCSMLISPTNHFQTLENDLVFRLTGRVKILHGAALYDFIKEGVVQAAVHKLKYKRRSEIGVILGKKFGERYIKSRLFEMADYIIPIPIHNKKKRSRSYNQCKKFADGIHEVTGIPILENVLEKNLSHSTQTKKTRLERFNNILNSFSLNQSILPKGKTVLLIDDVLTTGATIEAAIIKLSEIEGTRIQLGTIALANN